MARSGDTPRPAEQRAVGRWGKGLGTGLLIGGVAGVVVGLAIGVLAFDRAGATWTSALGGAIFGTVVGAFIGGMSTLEDPPPGEEPGGHDPSLGRPGLTHDEQDRSAPPS
ncbi:MAG: hypothetical protein WEE66_12380 [Actinomycetota bacterium]